MKAPQNSRLAARIHLLELRALLVADAHISLEKRQKLVHSVACLLKTPEGQTSFEKDLVGLIERRFGRNPDTFQLARSTLIAVRLLDAVQNGTYPNVCDR